jgi:hypothetical protein
MNNRWGIKLSALLISLTLIGCASKDTIPAIVYSGVDMPVLPPKYAVATPDPGVVVGKPLRSNLARNRAAYKTCEDQHVGYVDFYRKLRSSRPKPQQSVKAN